MGQAPRAEDVVRILAAIKMKDMIQTDPLRALRLKVDRPGHGYTPFQAKKRMEYLRRNWAKRTKAEQYRLHLIEQDRRAQVQEALRSERSLIRGFAARRDALPQHLKVRLSEIEGMLNTNDERQSGGRADARAAPQANV